MTALWALIRKDLLLFVQDRRALLLSLAMPIVLGAFFGYIFGGSGRSGDNAKIEIAVVSQDDSAVAKKVVAGLKADTALAVEELTLEDAKAKVLKGKTKAAVVIPAGFGEAAGAALFGVRDKPEIAVYYDPSQSAVLAMVKGMLTQQVMQNVSAEMMGGAGGRKLVDTSISQLDQVVAADPAKADEGGLRDFLVSLRKFQTRQEAAVKPAQTSSGATSADAGGGTSGGLSMPFTTRDEEMSSGPKYNGYAHAFAGMAVQFILFMGIDAGIGILLARRLGLWNRLLAAPITIGTILAARAISCALIALGILFFIFTVAGLFFQVQIAGSFAGFIGVCAAFALLTATFGLLIAAFGKTPEAARGMAIFATLIMVMLGGAWVPSFVFPQWMQTFTLVVPTRWAVDGLDAMTWRGLGLDVALPAIGVLLSFAMVFGLLAWWKFRREGTHA
jgi:ABC-2 type transport system permease protein